jgi:predicted GIY-YIG superfamily endonuclease
MSDYHSGIYCITDMKNGRKYIGQSSDVYVRRNQHFSALCVGLHNNKQMQVDFNKDKKYFK